MSQETLILVINTLPKILLAGRLLKHLSLCKKIVTETAHKDTV